VRLLLVAVLTLAPGAAATTSAGARPDTDSRPQSNRSCFIAETPPEEPRETTRRVEAGRVPVGPETLRTLWIRLLAGRDLVAADAFGAPVAIITASVAEALFPRYNPIGRRMYDCAARTWVTVVGVSADLMKDRTAAVHYVFVPLAQGPPVHTDN
jgi:hypothetical protein